MLSGDIYFIIAGSLLSKLVDLQAASTTHAADRFAKDFHPALKHSLIYWPLSPYKLSLQFVNVHCSHR